MVVLTPYKARRPVCCNVLFSYLWVSFQVHVAGTVQGSIPSKSKGHAGQLRA